MFIAHIGAMDAFALGLKKAAQLIESQTIPKMVAARYASFDSGFGKKIENGEVTLEDCHAFIEKNGLPVKIESGQQEAYELVFNRLIH